MSLKDMLHGILGTKNTPETPKAAAPVEVDIYSPVKSADEELFLAASHLKSLADGILEERGGRPPDAASLVEKVKAECAKEATDWLESQYALDPFLAEAYGNSWANSPLAGPMLTSVCSAMAASDARVASSLKQGLRLIAVAASAMTASGLFSMAGPGDPAAVTAVKNTNTAVAAAKTYILGL